MKKIGILLLAIIMITAAGIFFMQVRQASVDVTEEITKVGFILNGTIDDRSWGQAHYMSMEQTAGELNLDVDYRESVSQQDCEGVIDELVSEGCRVIIANSYEYGPYVEQAAETYPGVVFLHSTGYAYHDNMSSYFGRIYQIRYLCGMVAGLQTRTGQIGYVAAFNTSEVNRGINAFTLGVKAVNPQATVYVRWTDSWIDDDLTREATKRLLDDHKDIDVLTGHSDSLALYDEADRRNVWIIGYNMDNADKYPEHFLTAATWNWEVFYTEQIMYVLQDKFIGSNYWKGIESGMISLAPLTANVNPKTSQVVEETKERMINGQWDVFYGPIYDNEGYLRVADMENLTDEVLLTEFDWFVDGVVIDND